MHAVAAHEHHITHGAFLNFIGHRTARTAVTAHEAYAHFQVFLLGHLVDLKDLLGAIAVGGHRFFHEHIHASLHGVFIEHPTERRRCGEDGYIAFVEIADGFLVGLKADVGTLGQPVLSSLAEIDLLLMLFGKAVEAALEFILKNICGGHELGGAVSGRNGQRVIGGTRTAAARTHEGHLHRIVDSRVHMRNGHAGQRGGTGHFAGCLDEFTPAGRLG